MDLKRTSPLATPVNESILDPAPWKPGALDICVEWDDFLGDGG